jgi:hypothetical protein
MRALSAPELLSVWEQGLTQPPVQRALVLLASACPETSPKQLAELSVGQRDTLLLTLREWMFGSQLQSIASCPKCSNRLELSFKIADVRVATPAESAESFSLSVANYEVLFRLPNSLDLVACANQSASATGLGDPSSAQQALLERCLLAACHHGQEQPVTQLPADVISAVVAHMAEADPQADVQLNLSCAACSHQWHSTFDIVSFFWSEINVWALRILREVHILASTYGWREADILAMSPYRRQLYLEMVGG